MQTPYSSLQRAIDDIDESREEIIREYFYAAYTYDEIVSILFHHHGLTISLRQLKRILKSLGLRRRGRDADEEMLAAIQSEIQSSGSNLGYRSMTRRLLSQHGIAASRSLVSEVQRLIDPEGVLCRRRHQLNRRMYLNKGPNFLIHVDGYDKLKPYGFAIHGAICGFSRRILWLNVSNTNNDPGVIGFYYVNFVKEIKAVPRCIRSDAGTENGLMRDIQVALRWEHDDDMSAENSFLMGSSKSNQRIERWWLNCKQGGCQFWMDELKNMVTSGILSTANPLSMECARFCFMDVLQRNLDHVRSEWNQHRVRQSRGAESPGGKPDMMYFIPELYGTVDYKTGVDMDDIEAIQRTWCKQPLTMGCTEEVVAILRREMDQRGLHMPHSFDEAANLFGILLPTLG